MANPLHINYGDTLRQGTDKLNISIDHATEAKSQSVLAVSTADEAKLIAQTATDKADAAALVAIAAGEGADEAALNANTEAGNLEGLKTEVVDATRRAEQLTYVGVYDGGVTYAKNNIVSYNGSSYVAKVESTGVLPTVLANWGLAAQRGLDGSGAMVSLNGKLPDENGNVEIDAAELGAETPTGAQSKATKALNDAKAYTDSETADMASNFELQAHENKVASATELGHIKVGDNLSIDEEGNLSADASEVYALTDGPNAKTFTGDLDNLKDTGFYHSDSTMGATNLPSTGNYIITVRKAPDGTVHQSADWVTSVSSQGRVSAFHRICIASVWTAWMRNSPVVDSSLTNASHTDAASTYIAKQLNDMKVNKVQPAFTQVPSKNGWIAIDTVKYYKDETGVVHVQGWIQSGVTAANTVLFTFPASLKPLVGIGLMTVGTYNTGTDGRTVPIYCDNGNWLLDGIALAKISLNFSYRSSI